MDTQIALEMTPKVSKKEQLKEWCKRNGIFNKGEVIKWGLDNYYLRADTQIRQFIQDGYVRHLTEDEHKLYNIKQRKLSWYRWIMSEN